MVKRILILLIVSVSLVSLSFGNSSPVPETKDITVPVRKDNDKKEPNKHIPSIAIPVCISIKGNMIWIENPSGDYPMQVEIEMETEPYGYWTTILSDEQSTLDGFDGFHGDYRLSLETADGSSYIGYFTLE